MIAIYVNDILAACNDKAWMASFKAQLGAMFKIRDLCDLSRLLGMHITRVMFARTISIDQSKYVRHIPAKHNMSKCKLSPLPMDPGFLSGLARQASPLLTRVAKDVIYPNLMGNL
jgi:hypothetical protein